MTSGELIEVVKGLLEDEGFATETGEDRGLIDGGHTLIVNDEDGNEHEVTFA